MADFSDLLSDARPLSAALVRDREHYERVIAAVRRAECSVWIATANLKEMLVEGSWPRRRYRSVLHDLSELARKGVELRLMHASHPSRPFRRTFDKLPNLVGGGIELRVCPRLHFKAIIVDGAFLYLGSANWTGAGLGAKGEHRRNFELGLVTSDDGLLDEVQGIYERLWRGGDCASCRLRDTCEMPLDVVAKLAG
jgi:phosphatidylserine/phosphatidylglycerophosphate/cardiolipin synthase-like enzyme